MPLASDQQHTPGLCQIDTCERWIAGPDMMDSGNSGYSLRKSTMRAALALASASKGKGLSS
jgi:hypothetical protein